MVNLNIRITQKVHALISTVVLPFSYYATQVFLMYITSQLQYVSTLDVLWDEYFADSLKAETRTVRGKVIRRRVEPSNLIPGNWQEFLLHKNVGHGQCVHIYRATYIHVLHAY